MGLEQVLGTTPLTAVYQPVVQLETGAVLGYEVQDEEDGLVTIGSPEVPEGKRRRGPVPPALTFARVPEGKTVKNRLHLCLRPETTREQEVERLLGIGATLVADRREADGAGWAVLADPEGNEFCVLRSASDRAA